MREVNKLYSALSFIHSFPLEPIIKSCNVFFGIDEAIVSGGKGTAQDKIKSLRDAGVKVVESPAKIGAAMFELFQERGLLK
jgi:succinyl-CoA synthetase alpha subunit